MGDEAKKDKCRAEIQVLGDYREDIPEIVEKLVGTCDRDDCFDHVGPEPIPSRDAIVGIVYQLQRILSLDISTRHGLTGLICNTTWDRKQCHFLKSFPVK